MRVYLFANEILNSFAPWLWYLIKNSLPLFTIGVEVESKKPQAIQVLYNNFVT